MLWMNPGRRMILVSSTNIGNISETFQFLRDQKKIRRTHSLKNDPVDIPSSSAENLGFYRFFQRYLCSFLVKCHYQLLIGTTGKGNELCTDPSVDQSSLHISMFPCIIPVNGLQSPGKGRLVTDQDLRLVDMP